MVPARLTVRLSAVIALLLTLVISPAQAQTQIQTKTPAPAQSQALEALSPEQKNAVEDIVRQFIQDNPEFIIESLRTMRERQQASEREQAKQSLVTRRDELENDPTSPVGGNPKGDVTLVEFFDYRCGFCKRVYPDLKKLLAEDGNVRWVYKEFPILGPESVFASRAALAAWKMDEEKYHRFHDAMMASKGNLTEQKTLTLAAGVGLDVKTLIEGMADPEIDRVLEKNMALARALAINGTPAFVIGEDLIPGAIDLQALKGLVAKARNS